MNFIAQESPRKLRGGFYTHPEIAAFLVAWIREAHPASLLEPSCGDGRFLERIESVRWPQLQRVVACEIDPVEAASARARVGPPVEILRTDFLEWYDARARARDREVFDAVVGNPPFIRYQYLSEAQQVLAGRIFDELNLPFTRHTNAWVPFVLASLRMLRPGGRLGMVVPSELLHIPHADALRRYLAGECARVLVLDPEEIWFSETLQGTVLLLAEKKGLPTDAGRGVAVTPIAGRGCLATPAGEYLETAAYVGGTATRGKWMRLLLSAGERRLLEDLQGHPEVRPLADLATVDVGIVTGANRFFVVPDRVVDAFELGSRAHPMFGRSEQVAGLVYRAEDHAQNKADGLPANFLWFESGDDLDLPPAARRYLALGRAQSLHTRYKCRVRRPWYRVPSVYLAPVAMLKRAHHFPRLVLNDASAYTTDTAYRIVPRGGDAASLVLGFVNSLTCLGAELEGRHYGGGVLELVPSEIERLPVPALRFPREDLEQADQRFRAGVEEEAFLRENDLRVLGRLGLGAAAQSVLQAAWRRLRDRRHRRGSVGDPAPDAGGE